MSGINRVYATICLITAALAARGVSGRAVPCLENGAIITAKDFRSALESLASISTACEYRLTFANVLMAAAPALLWNVKRRGFSGCMVKAADNGMLLVVRR